MYPSAVHSTQYLRDMVMCRCFDLVIRDVLVPHWVHDITDHH